MISKKIATLANYRPIQRTEQRKFFHRVKGSWAWLAVRIRAHWREPSMGSVAASHWLAGLSPDPETAYLACWEVRWRPPSCMVSSVGGTVGASHATLSEVLIY